MCQSEALLLREPQKIETKFGSLTLDTKWRVFMKETAVEKGDVCFIFTGYSEELMKSMFKDLLNLANVKSIQKLLPFHLSCKPAFL